MAEGRGEPDWRGDFQGRNTRRPLGSESVRVAARSVPKMNSSEASIDSCRGGYSLWTTKREFRSRSVVKPFESLASRPYQGRSPWLVWLLMVDLPAEIGHKLQVLFGGL